MAIFAVINTMTLAKPLDADVTERMQDELMNDAHEISGFVEEHFVDIGDDKVVMIGICDSADSVRKLHDQVGSRGSARTWSLLARADRQIGPVLASSLN